MNVRATAFRGFRYALASRLIAAPLSAQQNAPAPAVPIETVPAILDAFRLHEVVALGDAHGNQQARTFLKSLVRDPRFASTVNDIVVEFGNARYQSLVDRYVNGADVPPPSLAEHDGRQRRPTHCRR